MAIIDLDPEANQPLVSADGQWEFVFNGEIYNYRELAASHGLSEKARRSDSWTLLELIEALGPVQAVRQLRGMYAFAAWQPARARLFLARDPFGIKPLAWTESNGSILFGSDPRSLATWRGSLGDSLDLDHYALTHYLMVGYIPGDATAWKAIHKVEPGACLEFDRDGMRVHEWDPLLEVGSNPPTLEEVDKAIRASVARHLVSDVEVGAFLSGGVDSSLIVALARRDHDAPMRTYSLGFDSATVHDESASAGKVAEMLGCRHTMVRLGAADFRRLAEEVAEAYPEPSADAAALPTLELSRRASEDVKVVLTGEGGDEMFGGYRRYWALPLMRGRVAKASYRIGLARLAARVGPRRLRQMAEAAGGNNEEALVRLLAQEHWRTSLTASPLATDELATRALCRYRLPPAARLTGKALQILELRRHLPDSYLEKTDRATMRHGLEARVPFLDLGLAEVALRLRQGQLSRSGRTKILLREVAARHLPVGITRAPKRGFSVPMAEWLRTEGNAGWVRDTLLEGEAVRIGLLDRDRLPAGVDAADGAISTTAAEEIYSLVALELWARKAKSEGAL